MDEKYSSTEAVDSGFCDSYDSIREGVASLNIEDSKFVDEKICRAEFQTGCETIQEDVKEDPLLQVDKDGDSLLHLTIVKGHTKAALQIIDIASPLLLNAQNMLGQTPLMLAVIVQSMPVMRKLVDFGADLGLCDVYGNNVIHLAATYGLNNSLKELFTESQCIPNKELAITYENLLESRNAEGFTPFHLAVMNKFFEAASILNYIGADVNAMDYKSGFTSLHHLVTMGNIERLQAFIDEFHPNIDARSYAGITPLQLTIGCKFPEIADVLIINGADTEFETDDCYSWARAHLREEMLVQYGLV